MLKRRAKSIYRYHMVGFNFGTVRSADVPKDRQRVIKEFISQASGIQVLVANVSTLALGVNLHACCSYGVFVWLAPTAQTMRQIISLVRFNQMRVVNWILIRLMYSYNDYQERSVCGKWLDRSPPGQKDTRQDEHMLLARRRWKSTRGC
ncbi:unnamed protein product [Clonostachys solani]|uniref:Helicase C-terminal domain-containing protein n=1 Tax=Clonostachys solani TaxID=160281 RepID=A0A9N9Z714_9HYPO|nr:unnamed protein product [Clonostachys solani]